MLVGTDKIIFEAAIKTLSNGLSSANEQCALIQDKLEQLSTDLITIETEMNAISDRLKRTSKGESEIFEEWRDDTRAKVYGGCAASIVLGPAGVTTCYTIAAIALETRIADYKREVEAVEKDFNSWAATFQTLATMAGQASAVSKEWYHKVVDFKTEV